MTYLARRDPRLFLAKVFFGACLAVLATFQLYAAREVFPAPLTDAGPHLIPAMNYRAGHGLGGEFWSLTRVYDPTGQHRFLQYPPLFHLVVAGLIREPTAQAVYGCLGGFTVATLLLSAVLMWQGSRHVPGIMNPAWVLLASLGLCAMATWLFVEPAAGRPESLTSCLMVLGTVIFLHVRESWRPVVAGVFIGMVAATQTVNAILLGFTYSVYASLSPSGEQQAVAARWFKQVATAATLGLLLFMVAMWASPHPVRDAFRGITMHFQQLQPVRHAVLSNYFTPNYGASFYGVFFVMLLVGFLRLERTRLRGLVAVNLALLLTAAWYFAVRASNLTYNVFAFVPLFTALAVRTLARVDGGSSVAPGRSRRITYLSSLVVFGLMSLGLFRSAITLLAYKSYGVSYAEAKQRLNELIAPDQTVPVCAEYSLWPLATRLDHLYMYEGDESFDHNPASESPRPMLLLHQWYGRWLIPPVVPGYELIWSNAIEHPAPRLLGIQVSATTPGYAFALYRPVGP